ncbi:MAG: polysaccharide deacetylase family protein [Clostridia bacterium]|nr:polysaccharide deacetylase family protein [Clostridia bacterium]
MVALTFDDGPHPLHTEQILDILASCQIKATFFVLGCNVELYPKPLLRASAEGHEIENHSYDHQTRGRSARDLSASIVKTGDIIERLTGKRPTYFRPPEGKSTKAVETAIRQLSLVEVFWTLDSRDWTGKSPLSIAQSILKEANGDEVILFHDYTCPSHNTMDALPVVIEGLKSKGYTFVTIDTYFSTLAREGALTLW